MQLGESVLCVSFDESLLCRSVCRAQAHSRLAATTVLLAAYRLTPEISALPRLHTVSPWGRDIIYYYSYCLHETNIYIYIYVYMYIHIHTYILCYYVIMNTICYTITHIIYHIKVAERRQPEAALLRLLPQRRGPSDGCQ